MAVYHLSVKPISRGKGQSVVASAAYRSGSKIMDERTGELKDFSRKGGVEDSALFAPEGAPEWANNRARLWNEAEASESRKNSTTGREIEIALPHELTAEGRRKLAFEFAGHLVERYGVAVDVNIHGPGRGGDERNHHAHILFTTRRLGPDGFTEKTRELDDIKKRGPEETLHLRAQWELLANRALAEAGQLSRIDHRSLTAQGIEDRVPTKHLGPAATAMERRGVRSERGRWNRRAAALHKALRRARKQEAAAKAASGPALVESALRQTESQVQRKFEEGARQGAALFENLFGQAKKPDKPEIHAKQHGHAGAHGVNAPPTERHPGAGGLGAAPPVQGAERPGAAVQQGAALPTHQPGQLDQVSVQLQPNSVQLQPNSVQLQPNSVQLQPNSGQLQPEAWEHGEGLSVHRQGKFAMRPIMDGSGRAELLTRQRDASTGRMVWQPAKNPCVGSTVAVMCEAERRHEMIARIDAGEIAPPGYRVRRDEQGRQIAVHPGGLYAVRPENPGRPGQVELLRRVDAPEGREAWSETGLKAAPRTVYAEIGRQMELVKPGREAVSAANAAYNAAGRKARSTPATAPHGQAQESLLDQVKRQHKRAEALKAGPERDAARLEVKQLARKLTPYEQFQLKKWREVQERQQGRGRGGRER